MQPPSITQRKCYDNSIISLSASPTTASATNFSDIKRKWNKRNLFQNPKKNETTFLLFPQKKRKKTNRIWRLEFFRDFPKAPPGERIFNKNHTCSTGSNRRNVLEVNAQPGDGHPSFRQLSKWKNQRTVFFFYFLCVHSYLLAAHSPVSTNHCCCFFSKKLSSVAAATAQSRNWIEWMPCCFGRCKKKKERYRWGDRPPASSERRWNYCDIPAVWWRKDGRGETGGVWKEEENKNKRRVISLSLSLSRTEALGRIGQNTSVCTYRHT